METYNWLNLTKRYYCTNTFFFIHSNSICLSTIVGKIVNHFETYKLTNQGQDGIYLAICLIAILLMRSISFNTFDTITSHTAMKLRIATCNIIYNKVHFVCNFIYLIYKQYILWEYVILVTVL